MASGGPIDLTELRWGFITSHAQMLLAVAQQPGATVAELADATQITERSAYRMLADLQQAGYLRRRRLGRNNVYQINPALPLGDPPVETRRVRDLLALLAGEDFEAHVLVRPMARRAPLEARRTVTRADETFRFDAPSLG